MTFTTILRAALLSAMFATFATSPAGAVAVGFTGVAPEDAVGGYDAVALSEGQRIRGQGRYTYVFRGLQWRFANDANKQRFRLDPDQYIQDLDGGQ